MIARLAVLLAAAGGLLLGVSVTSGAQLAGTVPERAAWESDWFHSPSGNIRCRYFWHATNPLVACITLNDRAMVGVRLCCRPGFKRWGYGNRTFPAGPVLRYGESWRVPGEFRCSSSSDGMRCRSLVSGHGFFISRDLWDAW